MSGSSWFAPDRVVWAEGMLVSPQHMQQQARFHDRMLATRLRAVAPYDFGVLELEIDRNALASDQLALERLTAILPDGSPVTLTKGREGAPAPREVTPAFPVTQRTLGVFVGMVREREGAANVAGPENPTQRARYALEARDVADLVGGREARASVAFGRPVLTVLFGAEANDDYDCIKVAELVRDAAGALVPSEAYVPPCLQIGASPFIMAGLRRLLGLVTSRQRALAETCRERTSSALEFQSTDITAFLQLSALNAMIPVMQHFVDAPQISPWQTYVLLSQLTGQLSTFGTEVDPATLPKFSYTDLGTTFRQLFEHLTQLLSATVIKRYIALPLKLYPNGVLLAELEDSRLQTCKTFVLTAKAETSELPQEKLALDLPKLSKIGSKTTIKSIVQAAASGVPLQVARRVPAEIPIRDGTVYFLLNVGDPAWKPVLNDRNVALYMPPPCNPGKVKYELLAVPEEG